MRARAISTILAWAVTIAVAGCALTFAPGDYGGGLSDDAVADASTGDVVTGDGPTTSPDGAPAAPSTQLLVIAGERDGSDTATSDVWLAPIDAKGDVGPFAPLQPAFFRGAPVVSTVASGRLFVAMRAAGRSIEHVAFDGGVTGPWEGESIAQPPSSGYGQVFSGTSLLAFGGASSVPNDGGSELIIEDVIRVTPFDGVMFQPMTTSPTKLPLGLRDMMTVTYKDFVYIVGGSSSDDEQGSKVYVARRDATAGVASFAETTRVVNPQNSQPHTPASPILCAAEGRMFFVGGSNTDIVLVSAINETDGTLGMWRAATKLPGPLRSAGCAVWNGAVHLIGGIGLTSRSDRIIRAPITGDGLLGDWDLSSGEKLPAPRSSIVAVTY